jgi:Fe-S cluster biogenesis protein NfuA
VYPCAAGAKEDGAMGAEATPEGTGLHDRLEAALEAHARPRLRAEGGDVELVGVDADRIVQVRFLGTCAGCGSGSYVLTMELEGLLKPLFPEIRFIESVP